MARTLLVSFQYSIGRSKKYLYNKRETLRMDLASLALLIPWMIWKQRNDCVFEGALPSVWNTIGRIQEEAVVWARAGPETGHVHDMDYIFACTSSHE